MESDLIKRNERRCRRVRRVRKKVRGDATRPRLCVYKTNRHVSAQIVDDESGVTLLSAGTQHTDFGQGKKSKESARKVGQLLAEKAKNQSISKVVFDRGRYKFHGVIAELAAGAREAGLQF